MERMADVGKELKLEYEQHRNIRIRKEDHRTYGEMRKGKEIIILKHMAKSRVIEKITKLCFPHGASKLYNGYFNYYILNFLPSYV